jgi:hypothetical protein
MAGSFLPPGKNVENVTDSSSPPVKQQRDNAAKIVPGRKNPKIIPDRRNRNEVGAAKTVGFFLPRKKNAANSGDISSLPAKKQKNTVAENVLNHDRKRDGAVKTVGFFLPPKKNAASKEDSSSLPANKPKNTARKNVLNPGRKKAGAARTARFFLPEKQNVQRGVVNFTFVKKMPDATARARNQNPKSNHLHLHIYHICAPIRLYPRQTSM